MDRLNAFRNFKVAKMDLIMPLSTIVEVGD